MVFRLDSTGALVWQRDYAVGVDVHLQSLALTSDGGAIVSGTVSTQTATTYSSSVLLLKLDSTGKAQFARTILPSGNIPDLSIVGVQQTADGGYAFAGYYFHNTVYTERAWLVKTDSAGNVQWDNIYGPDVQYANRYFHSFQQTSDGWFIAAGSTNQFNGGANSIWLVKTDSNGNVSSCADVHKDSAATGNRGNRLERKPISCPGRLVLRFRQPNPIQRTPCSNKRVFVAAIPVLGILPIVNLDAKPQDHRPPTALTVSSPTRVTWYPVHG